MLICSMPYLSSREVSDLSATISIKKDWENDCIALPGMIYCIINSSLRGALRRSNPGLSVYTVMTKNWYIYIIANQKNGTLYVWVTSNLLKRIREHKNNITEGFTSKYSTKLLVYYEDCGSIESAILREKQLKWWSRKRKIDLIESINPSWRDLYDDICE